MDITGILMKRYTTKAFDPDRKIDPAIVEQIEALLRYSPSSTNFQPWHFIIAGTEEGKARVAKATAGRYGFNTDKIMKAQIARGADFESGNLITKAKNLVPLLVPLFISAFRRANDLAMAMEARCYRGGEGRTKMKPLQYKKRDYLAYGMLVLYLILIVAEKLVLE